MNYTIFLECLKNLNQNFLTLQLISELENEYVARYVHEIETSMEDSEEAE